MPGGVRQGLCRHPLGVGGPHFGAGVDQRQGRFPSAVGRRQHQGGPILFIPCVQIGSRPDQHLDDGRLTLPGHAQEIAVKAGLREGPRAGQQ